MSFDLLASIVVEHLQPHLHVLVYEITQGTGQTVLAGGEHVANIVEVTWRTCSRGSEASRNSSQLCRRVVQHNHACDTVGSLAGQGVLRRLVRHIVGVQKQGQTLKQGIQATWNRK